MPGVGTNRYAYAGGDPINLRDPGGNAWRNGESYENWQDFVTDWFVGERNELEDGTIDIESPEILRFLVPGQIPYDQARSDVSNGDYVMAALHGTAAIGEMAAILYGGALVNTAVDGTRASIMAANIQTPTPQVSLNAIQGAVAEARAASVFSGEIVGRQVTFVTSTGQRTRMDFVLNGWRVLEVKTGGATLSRNQAQLLSDIVAGRAVIPVGRRAVLAGFLHGRPITLSGFIETRPGLLR
jgi:hypothetical protein